MDLLVDRVGDGEVVTCVPVVLEVLVGAPNATEVDRDWLHLWSQLDRMPLTDVAAERALAVMRSLAATTAGAHRRRPIDYLIAATAEQAGTGVVLWHWDADLTTICKHTGQPHEPEHPRAAERGFD